MRDKTLFLGNGLNRTLTGGISWEELMVKLGSNEPKGAGVPFPIEFEQIAAQKGCQIGRRNRDPYEDLRKEIVDALPKPRRAEDDVHAVFSVLPFNHVITTNYDRIFEAYLEDLSDSKKNFGSAKNILEAVSSAGDVDVYHAHGIDRLRRTLCLGHEHYASLIGKIRSFFYPNGEDNEGILANLVKGDMGSLQIWPEYLFTNDVAIVGFGLDYCETDIWWLLALRAALFSPHGNNQSFENRITFYRAKIGNEELSVFDSCHDRALQSLGVEVRTETSASYKDAYESIAAEIRKSWA